MLKRYAKINDENKILEVQCAVKCLFLLIASQTFEMLVTKYLSYSNYTDLSDDEALLIYVLSLRLFCI
jgi:hypothetical protein